MNRNLLIYTLIGVGLSTSLAASFQSRLTIHPYVTWIGACSIVTWALYAWDKRTAEFAQLSKRLKGWRVPELTLNLLALIGGFPGAWVGRTMFNHKTNVKRHRGILVVLLVSVFLHAAIVVRLLYGPPFQLWPPSNWITF
ncbi:MAG: DUF1294 domain-containing protein [Anaerolineae bacterium]|nr:DUF1294 domain-containing protein [Anaerolineae bacterium]